MIRKFIHWFLGLFFFRAVPKDHLNKEACSVFPVTSHSKSNYHQTEILMEGFYTDPKAIIRYGRSLKRKHKKKIAG